MGKTALVVSGGGGKGAFAVGVAGFLAIEKGVRFDLYAGTSTGAIVSACMAAGKIQDLLNFYGTASSNDLFTPREAAKILKSSGVFGANPLRQRMEQVLDVAATTKILAGATPIFLTTVSLQTGELVYFHTCNDVKIDPPARAHRLQTRVALLNAIMASAMVPVMLPPVDVLSRALDAAVPPLPVGSPPGQAIVADQYVDGGAREYAPLKVVIDHGATEIYAVVLSPLQRCRRNQVFGSVLDLLPRVIDILTEDVAENDLEVAERYNRLLTGVATIRRSLLDQGVPATAVEEAFTKAGAPFTGKSLLNVHVIAPETPLLKGDSLVFDKFDMARMMAVGRLRAETVLGSGP
jgi:predicted acylesterase/phospholipase RssA